MDPMRLLMRAKRLAQNPPGWKQIALYGGVIAASLAIAGVEWVWGWPEWLTPEKLKP